MSLVQGEGGRGLRVKGLVDEAPRIQGSGGGAPWR